MQTHPQHNDTDYELTGVVVVEVHEDYSKTQNNKSDISASEQSIPLSPQESTHDHIKKKNTNQSINMHTLSCIIHLRC